MKGIDLSKFKKVSSDAHVTTLRHPDGHEFRVAHKVLSPKLKKDLHALPFADGGEAVHDATDEVQPGTPESNVRVETAIASKNLKEVQEGNHQLRKTWTDAGKKTKDPYGGYAKGGAVKMAEGEEVLPNWQDIQASTPSQIEESELPTPPGAAMAAAKDLLTGGPPVTQAALNGQEPTDADRALATATPPGAAAPAEAAPDRAPASLAPEGPKADELPKVGLNDIYKEGTAGLQQEYKAEKQLGAAKTSAIDEHVQNLQDAQERYQTGVADKTADIDSAIQDFKDGHINPNHFMESKSALGKVSTAIGLIIGGLGTGTNGAQDFLNKQIDRDIDSQRAEMGKRQTLIGAYQKQFDNAQVAEQMTRATELGIYAAHLDAAAAKAMDPLAKAKLLQQSSQFKAQILPLVHQAQMRQELTSQAQQSGVDPSKFVQFVVPEKHQEAVFKEIERAQDTRKSADTIMKAFDRATEDNTFVKRAGGLRGDPGSVLALRQALQPTFKDIEGTVRQAAMDNTFENVVPARGDTDARKNEKRAALQAYVQAKSSAPTAKGFGIDLDKFKSTTAAPVAKTVPDGATGTDKQGRPVVFSGGKWLLK